MARILNNLQAGDRIEIIMVTGEIQVARYKGWVWHQGLLPGLNYVGEPNQAGDTIVEESGWIARALIGRIRILL